MATQTTGGGSTTSFTNAPQAGTDTYWYDEEELSGYSALLVDVMANDSGGNAKILWSIDDGSNDSGLMNGYVAGDLLTQDQLTSGVSAWQQTAEGNWIRINNGQVEYRLGNGTSSNPDNFPPISFDAIPQGLFTDTFTYAIRMANGTLSWATVTVNIQGNNDAPVANADTGSTTENATVSVDVLANDTDVDQGAVLSLVSASGPAGKGSASIVAGQVQFDPGSDFDHLAAGATEDVVINYTMQDEHGAQSSSTLTITVTGTNDAPALTGTQPTLAGGTEDQSYIVSKASLLQGFTDVDDGTVLGVMSLTADHGTVIDNGNGTYTITPQANYNGTVTLSYNVVDGDGGSVPATLSFNLAAVNDPSIIGGPITGTVVEATPSDPGVPTASGTLTSDDSADGNPPNMFIAQASTATATGYGSFTMSASGLWTYTLNNANPTVNALMTGMFLIDTFTVQSADGTTQTITVTINGATDAIVVTPPAKFNGTGDPNDFDSLTGGTLVAGNFTGTNSGETITGGAADQTFNMNNGNDTAYGAGGNDIITGGDGNDNLYGQVGNDQLFGQGGVDELYGGSGNDQLDGGDNNDLKLFGGSGDDIIVAGDGNDNITGGYGADTLTGGSGNDDFVYLDLKDTNDTILDFMDAGNDQIDLTAIDAIAGGSDDAFGWGGTTPTANSLWFSESGGNTTLYGDTDGNVATAEFMILLPGFTGFNAYSNPLTPPPDITF